MLGQSRNMLQEKISVSTGISLEAYVKF